MESDLSKIWKARIPEEISLVPTIQLDKLMCLCIVCMQNCLANNKRYATGQYADIDASVFLQFLLSVALCAMSSLNCTCQG